MYNLMKSWIISNDASACCVLVIGYAVVREVEMNVDIIRLSSIIRAIFHFKTPLKPPLCLCKPLDAKHVLLFTRPYQLCLFIITFLRLEEHLVLMPFFSAATLKISQVGCRYGIHIYVTMTTN